MEDSIIVWPGLEQKHRYIIQIDDFLYEVLDITKKAKVRLYKDYISRQLCKYWFQFWNYDYPIHDIINNIKQPNRYILTRLPKYARSIGMSIIFRYSIMCARHTLKHASIRTIIVKLI